MFAAAGFAALTVNDVWLRVSADRSFMSRTVLYPALLAALAVGLGMQSRRVRVQHAELVALRQADRARAVSEERRRLARDLHDVNRGTFLNDQARRLPIGLVAQPLDVAEAVLSLLVNPAVTSTTSRVDDGALVA